MEVQIAVAKINKYAVSESGDTLEVVERPNGGLSVVLADGQSSGRGAKAVSMMVVRRVISLLAEGVRDGAWTISRFKGLGEMNAEQLWDTTLNPDTRRLLPVHLGSLSVLQTSELMTKLMGKGEAAARRELMELHGDSVEIDV